MAQVAPSAARRGPSEPSAFARARERRRLGDIGRAEAHLRGR